MEILKNESMAFYPMSFIIDKNGQKKASEYPKNTFWDSDNTYEKCENMLKHKKSDSLFLGLTSPNYLILDTDSKEAYKKLKKILKEKDLYNRNSITESISNRLIGDTYKNHFWFKVEPEEFIKVQKGAHIKGNPKLDLDWFYMGKARLFEYIDSEIDTIELSFNDFKTIMEELEIVINYENEEKKPKEKKIIVESESDEEEENKCDNKKMTNDEKNIKKMLLGLDKKRWENFENWLKIGMVFKNEEWDFEVFNEISKNYKGYDEEKNEIHVKSLKKTTSGYKVGTLYKWLKEDNINLFNELQEHRLDFWFLMNNFNQKDIATFYYNLNCDKFIRCDKTGWYEYNDKNILKFYGDTPSNLLFDISDKIQKYINEQKNYIKLTDNEYNIKMKIIKKNYDIAGSSGFVEGIIKFLKNLYLKIDLYKIIDNNTNLLCFNNKLFDIKQKKFRDIEPTDYVSKTTNYEIDEKSNAKIREAINAIFWSIFENVETVEYWKIITGLSLFTNKMQEFYMNTGCGGNGKGILSKLIELALGDYFYSPENTFLTTVLKGNAPNSSLVRCRGTRHVRVLEPDDGSNNSKINEDFLKLLTGGSKITCRDLFGKMLEFDNTFTVHMECNTKPKLGKFEEALRRRFRVLPYNFRFVDEVIENNDRQRDYELVEKISNKKYINEFMLILLETATNYINVKVSSIKVPKCVLTETEEYFNDNNMLKYWIEEYIKITKDEKKMVKSSFLYEKYIETTGNKISQMKFMGDMKTNGFIGKRYKDGVFYCGIETNFE